MSGEPWFAHRRYGFGVSPANRKGWLALLAIVIANAVCLRLLRTSHVAAIWIVLFEAVLIAGVIWLCIAKSRGEWRWRWGDKD